MSSTNVVPHPKLVGPLDVAEALDELRAAGIISHNAFSLGYMVLLDMHKNGVRQTIYTGARASKTYLRRYGKVFAGAISRDLYSYIEALQDLQVRAGVRNNITEPEEFSPDALRKHFTANPTVQAGKHYSLNTPIYFALPDLSVYEYRVLVNGLLSIATRDQTPLEV